MIQTVPLRLACDASAYEVGAVISHIMPDKSEKPIAFTSHTLTKAESNYSQLEKETLSIILGIQKFHQYLYGRKFTLVMVGPNPSFILEFKPTEKHSNADGVSRLPLPHSQDVKGTVSEATLYTLQQLDNLPVTANQICKATRNNITFKSETVHFNRMALISYY